MGSFTYFTIFEITNSKITKNGEIRKRPHFSTVSLIILIGRDPTESAIMSRTAERVNA